MTGLSFKPNAVNKLKILQNHLTRRNVLAKKQKIIIWHDVINRTISKHWSNSNTFCSTEELKEILRTFSDRIGALIYLREGTIHIWDKFIKTRFPIVDVTKKPLSHRKQKDLKILKDVDQVHRSFDLEERLLKTVWKKRNLLSQVVKRRNERKTSSPRRRHARNKGNNSSHRWFSIAFAFLSLSLFLSRPLLVGGGYVHCRIP